MEGWKPGKEVERLEDGVGRFRTKGKVGREGGAVVIRGREERTKRSRVGEVASSIPGRRYRVV